jgi:hypothetical protein
MEWMRSESGYDVVMLNDDTYINFGDEEVIKWVHLSFVDHSGTRRGQMFPVTLSKIKREYSQIIGKKNLKIIRELLTPRIESGQLTRLKFLEVGTAINSENK